MEESFLLKLNEQIENPTRFFKFNSKIELPRKKGKKGKEIELNEKNQQTQQHNTTVFATASSSSPATRTNNLKPYRNLCFVNWDRIRRLKKKLSNKKTTRHEQIVFF